MNLLEDLKKSLLNFSFIMMYTIHEILVLVKNHLNHFRENILECFFKKSNRLLLFKMESFSLEKENIIKYIRNLFRLKGEQDYTAIKGIRNLFRQEKETKATKDRILRDIKNLFEYKKEEKNYYKPARVINFCSNNYIEYEITSDKIKTLSLEEYLNNISHYLK